MKTTQNTTTSTPAETKEEMLDTMAEILRTFDQQDLKIVLAFMRGLKT